MATFQEIRHYLETHHDELALTLSADDKTQFQTTFERLHRDWNQNIAESGKREVTLREMSKYPPVWKQLVAANLVQEEQRHDPTPTSSAVSTDVTANAGSARSEQVAKPVSERQPSQSVNDRLAIWKELITGIMGALIVLVTLGIAVATIFSAGNQANYTATKDILLFMNGLVGVVLGYYFGRVPGDARADKAESETKSANSSRDQVLATVRTVLDEGSRSLERGVNAGEVNLTSAQVESLRRVLHQYGR